MAEGCSLPPCPQCLPSLLSFMRYHTLHFFLYTSSPVPLPSLADSAHQKWKFSLLGLPTVPLSCWGCDLWCCCLTLELFSQHLWEDSSAQMCSTWKCRFCFLAAATNKLLLANWESKRPCFPKMVLAMQMRWLTESGRRLRFKWYSLCIPLVHSESSWPTSLWSFLPYCYAIQILQVRVALSEKQKWYSRTDWVPTF